MLAVPDSMPRLLAFHDHAKGLQRSVEGDRRTAALLPVTGALDHPNAPHPMAIMSASVVPVHDPQGGRARGASEGAR